MHLYCMLDLNNTTNIALLCNFFKGAEQRNICRKHQ